MSTVLENSKLIMSKGILTIVKVLGAAAVLAMMIFVVGNAAARFLFGVSIPGSSEYISLLLMPLAISLGIVLAAREKDHLEVDILSNVWSGGWKRLAEIIMNLIVVVFLALLVVVAVPFADEQRMLDEIGSASGMAVWPLRYVLILGLFGYAVVALKDLIKHLVNRPVLDPSAKGATDVNTD